jgi:hypothetical protein
MSSLHRTVLRESAARLKVLREAGTVIISPLVLTHVDHLGEQRQPAG